jgi:polyisoprenyl-teichoic acid--peptidoglycan teichoic acid transferase
MFKKRKPAEPNLDDQLQAQAAVFPPIGTTLPSPYYHSPVAGTMPSVEHIAMKPKRGLKWYFKKFLIIVLVLGLVSGIYVGVKFLMNASRTFDGNLFGLLQNEKLKGEEDGRVNILVAGNSADDPGHGGAELTDSIMLISIDTENKRAFTMSIPRDLWVDSPTDGFTKINAVYQYGQEAGFHESGYPDGGMGALEKVVGENFGIPIHYYALINYTAFKQAVDAVGGIDVTIQSDDARGLYDPSRDWAGPRGTPLVRLSNGRHHLDGHEALNLARARGQAAGSYGYAQSDYTRTANQRLMLVALKEKSTSAGVALNPIRIASLLDSFGANVVTDFKTTEIRRLVDIAKEVPSDKITSVGLNDVDGKSLLSSYRSSNGQSSLIPKAGRDDYTDIQAYIESLVAPPPAPAENTSGQ